MKMTIYDDTPNPKTFTPSTAATLCAPLAAPQCLLFWNRISSDNSLTTVCSRLDEVSWSSLQRHTNITRRHIRNRSYRAVQFAPLSYS